jgi:uncharacterized protein (TIGR02099 family)
MRALLRLMFWGVWVLGAVSAALHFWIVPRIADYRPQLEALSSQALGVPVRVGQILAQSNGLVPSFELREVQLLDAQGATALRLPRVLVALSLPSLLRRGFAQIYLDQPVLEIRRTAAGQVLVAGLDFAQGAEGGDSAAADWFFAQHEFVIHHGTVRWVDEQRSAPPLQLQQLDLVLRNGARRHELRLDATPPAGWGHRFQVQGQFRRPLLSGHPGRWADWGGQLYADLAWVDVSQLRRYVNLGRGVDVDEGRGALRAWVDVNHGQFIGGTLDLALAQVSVTLGPELTPLGLTTVTGRLSGRRLGSGLELRTEGLQFHTRSGLRWPGGNLMLSSTPGDAHTPAQGQLQADRLDLAALSQIASSLPLGSVTHTLLQEHPVQGLVETVQAHWQGPANTSAQRYDLRARISGLAVATAAAPVPNNTATSTATNPAHAPPLGTPGLRGATVVVNLNQDGGKLQLQLNQGALEFPGVFAEPLLPFDRFSLDAQWQVQGQQIVVPKFSTRFANADAEGELSGSWHTSDPARTGSRFPGEIDAQGRLSRADGTKVYRYLPLTIPQDTRDYLRDAILQGRISDLAVRLKGDLDKVPFGPPHAPGAGEFRLAGQVHHATYAYVPPRIQPPGQLPWPVLTDLNGELVIDRATLKVNQASARLQSQPGVQVNRVDAHIPDLMSHTTVHVQADVQGPLAEMLGVVNQSPLGQMVNGALAQASASGPANLHLGLTLPVNDINNSKVQGSVQLAGNDVRVTPAAPLLSKARGQVNFTEFGFSLTGTQAQMIGGDVRLDGGMRGGPPSPGVPAVQVRAQGQFTAEGLRQAPELGLPARLAQQASGGGAYSAVLGFRRGVAELTVHSNLQGVALHLPAPLGKAADTVLPLRFDNALLPDPPPQPGVAELPLHERLQVELGSLARVVYVRDLAGAVPKVLRGSIAVGLPAGEGMALPEQGVAANVNLPQLSADAWDAALDQLSAPLPQHPEPGAGQGATATAAASGPAAQAQSYLPTTMALRAAELTVGGRQLHHVLLGGTREGWNWRINTQADQLNGYVDYRQPSAGHAGRVYARLVRLQLDPATASDVEQLLEQKQPSAIPALDIVVDDFELRGKKLGRVEIEASNPGAGRDGTHEWRLSKLKLDTPEAQLLAWGHWAAAASGPVVPTVVRPDRRTVLNFKLDINDAGALLARMGMPDVIRRGQGQLGGQVSWAGSPLSPDLPTLDGQVRLDVGAGQFLKADPGLAKLLGVLSLQALPRRLTLDFRDVFSAGFAFDFVRGDVSLAHGIASTHNLEMQGVNAAVMMEGSADVVHETQNLHVVVVPEINAGTASLLATVVNPAVGLSTVLAQLFLRRPLIQATTQVFDVDGPWADPRITKATTPPAAPTAPASAQPASAARTAP